MAEPADMIVPMLREMRAEMNARFDQVATRLAALEAGQKSIRHALAADTTFSRMLVGEYEERIEALERKVKELEEQK
jgi:polyhydroxyalkanoate synthesis regulator phasin